MPIPRILLLTSSLSPPNPASVSAIFDNSTNLRSMCAVPQWLSRIVGVDDAFWIHKVRGKWWWLHLGSLRTSVCRVESVLLCVCVWVSEYVEPTQRPIKVIRDLLIYKLENGCCGDKYVTGSYKDKATHTTHTHNWSSESTLLENTSKSAASVGHNYRLSNFTQTYYFGSSESPYECGTLPFPVKTMRHSIQVRCGNFSPASLFSP